MHMDNLRFSFKSSLISSVVSFRLISSPVKIRGTLTVAEPLILKNVDYNVIFLSNFLF